MTIIQNNEVVLQDISGSITSANVSQVVVAANQRRNYLFIQNISTATLGINFTAAATLGQGSVQISPGGSFVMEGAYVTTEQINIIGATIGQLFTAKEA